MIMLLYEKCGNSAACGWVVKKSCSIRKIIWKTGSNSKADIVLPTNIESIIFKRIVILRH